MIDLHQIFTSGTRGLQIVCRSTSENSRKLKDYLTLSRAKVYNLQTPQYPAASEKIRSTVGKISEVDPGVAEQKVNIARSDRQAGLVGRPHD